MTDRSSRPVWYASYGSNCDAARFSLYLAGGEGDGAPGSHRGARNPGPPLDSAPMEFDSQITFNGLSKRWGGGVAFLEHQRVDSGTPGALGRRYLVTQEQFEDVVAQENRRPTMPLPFESISPGETRVVGEGWYDALVSLRPVAGVPVFTFTSSTAPESSTSTPPALTYLRTVASGLLQAHDLTLAQVVDRLRVPGVVAASWTAPELLNLLR